MVRPNALLEAVESEVRQSLFGGSPVALAKIPRYE
jgi:hypothetical protein